MKNVEDYKARHVFGFNRPIEYNWRGDKLTLVSFDIQYIIAPMGPNSPYRGVVSVVDLDEDNETITLSDTRKELVVTFDDWAWMKPYGVTPERLNNFHRKVRTVHDVHALFERPILN